MAAIKIKERKLKAERAEGVDSWGGRAEGWVSCVGRYFLELKLCQ